MRLGERKKWCAAFCDVLNSFLETVKTVYMSPWHSGRISIQHWRTQRLSQVWRRSKGSRPALSTGSWTGLCDISISYWLRGTALWAPSASWLHSVTPSFQLLICGTLDLNILPYALAAITFKRRPLHQTAAMTTGILTTRGITRLKSTLMLLCMNVHLLCICSSVTLNPPISFSYKHHAFIQHFHSCFQSQSW